MQSNPISVKKLIHRAVVMLMTLLVTLAFTRPGEAAYGVIVRKISGTSPAFTNLKGFNISPDSQHVVFIADRTVPNLNELYVVPTYGGAEPLKISMTMVNGGGVRLRDVGMTNERAVYMANEQSPDKTELYSVPLTGGGGAKLSRTLATGGNVEDFKISPDGQWVVYRADRNGDDFFELYSTPITGGINPDPLNGTLMSSGYVFSDYTISSNSQWVVYRAQQDTLGVDEIYRTAIGGGASVRLNTGTLAGHYVSEFKVTPAQSGPQVVIFLCNTAGLTSELYSNTIGTAGTPFKLSNIVPASGSVSSFEITPNSLGVVYRANQEDAGLWELYSNNILGTDPRKLSGTLPAGFTAVDGFEINSTSTGVVYKITNLSIPEERLYSNFVTGGGVGTPVRVSGPIVTGGRIWMFHITNNDTRVAYYSDAEVLHQDHLYSVPITGLPPGGQPIDICADLVEGGGLLGAIISPDRLGAMFWGSIDSTHHTDLYFNFTQGGIPFPLNKPLPDGGISNPEAFTPNSQVVVYISNQDDVGKSELYVAFLGWQVALPLVIK